MKTHTLILISLFAFFMVSCSSMHNFVNKDINLNGKMAVIIADIKYNDVNKLYANDFTELFTAQSKLTILTQKQVKSALGSYPERIQGPYKIIGADEPQIDYNLIDMDSLAAIAKKLNVQYLYVFWIPLSMTDILAGTELIKYWYISELIEFPSRKVIAQGNMFIAYVPHGSTNGPRTIEEMCKFYSEAAVKDIIQNTGIGK